MDDKKKPWQRKLKDYLYKGAKKVVPKKIKKIVKAVKSIKVRNIVEGGKRKLEIYKDIPMLDDVKGGLKKQGEYIDKSGDVKPYTPHEGLASDTAKGKKMRDALMKEASNANKKQHARLKKGVTDRAKRSTGKNGGNGHPPKNGKKK
tara:strand:- start:1178 stop:1618 length:441 start_codon:yes stop_codon:yes gene_type:complete